MSLETLLEAAEYLEWSKTGKKSSRGKYIYAPAYRL